MAIGALVILMSPGMATMAMARPIRILALGDSLTAGYLLPEKDAFPVVLERALRAAGHDVEVVNAGVSGDTARAATSGEVQDLRRESRALKECVADLTLENRLLKKSMIAGGGDEE